MHRVGSAGHTTGSTRPRREKRLAYVLSDADDTKHCAGINCLAVLNSAPVDGHDYLFTGSRDGTLKRWDLTDNDASCSATFESHVDWVNDAVLAGGTLVSCSSDTTLKHLQVNDLIFMKTSAILLPLGGLVVRFLYGILKQLFNQLLNLLIQHKMKSQMEMSGFQ